MKSLYFLGAVLSSPSLAQQVVNAPVAPDTIYVGRAGATSGLSVIDLNGFGAGSGDPTYDMAHPIAPGHSNFPNNPNVALQGALMFPTLFAGTTTIDGGSAGVFTLTRDSNLADVLFALDPGDMMLGHPLGLAFSPPPGNRCGGLGLQLVRAAFVAPRSLVPAGALPPIYEVHAGGSPISWAPHPNPPALDPATLDLDQPTSFRSALAQPEGTGLTNLLAPGPNFLGIPAIGLPPTNMLARSQNAFFVGPDRPLSAIEHCRPFMVGSPVGHFLYAIDRAAGDLLALDSNRMLEFARVRLSDPAELAMSPELDLLAVSERGADSIAFLGIDPRNAARFHRVVHRVNVGKSPSGIAWEPGNEDVFVCNEGDGTVSILSAASLRVRKTLRGFDRPFAVAITPRQDKFGLERNLYFAYVLERSGVLSLFESGPGGGSGWGYDDVILRARFRFAFPRAMQPDLRNLDSGVWIAHMGQLDTDGNPTGSRGGALTQLTLRGARGQQPLVPGEPPHPRQLELAIVRSIGSDQLTGVPLDIAFDDQQNLGLLRNHHTPFSAREPAPTNGKNLVREVSGVMLNTSQPSYLFAPVWRRSGAAVDVIDLDTGRRVDTNPFLSGIQSIPAAGARGVMSYFRQ